MPRMIDRLRTEAWHYMGTPAYDIVHNRAIAGLISKSVPVIADNVAQYWHDQELVLPMSGMPSIMPPFPQMWIEARRPVGIERGGYDAWGALVLTREIMPGMPEPSPKFFMLEDSKEMWKKVQATGASYEVIYIFFANPDSTLVQEYERIMGTPAPARDMVSGPILVFRTLLDKQGMYIVDPRVSALPIEGFGEPLMVQPCMTMKLEKFEEKEAAHIDQITAQMALSYLRVLIFSVGLMNCKNVELVTVNPPPKLSMKRQKRFGKPLVKYKVLNVSDGRPIANRSNRSVTEGTAAHNALHVCRGHFRTYGGDHGLLFGRHSGTFWVPAHLKGRKSEGMIVKTYNVEKEEENDD